MIIIIILNKQYKLINKLKNQYFNLLYKKKIKKRLKFYIKI